MKRVAVVILNYNGASMLEKFLPSVVAFSPEADVVVADNASTDNSIGFLKANYPALRIIELDRNYGFADGYNRKLSNKGKVRIREMDAPIIGRVCMDQFMVDVTDIPNVQRGDTVALLDDHVSILWMANLLDVNVDEIVCGISKRVPRVYEVSEGEN